MEWIKVEEGMPDEGVCVLTYSKDAPQGGKFTVSIMALGFLYPDDEGLIEITHWMPLPEPPKE